MSVLSAGYGYLHVGRFWLGDGGGVFTSGWQGRCVCTCENGSACVIGLKGCVKLCGASWGVSKPEQRSKGYAYSKLYSIYHQCLLREIKLDPASSIGFCSQIWSQHLLLRLWSGVYARHWRLKESMVSPSRELGELLDKSHWQNYTLLTLVAQMYSCHNSRWVKHGTVSILFVYQITSLIHSVIDMNTLHIKEAQMMWTPYERGKVLSMQSASHQ